MIGDGQTAVFVDLANFYSSLIRSGIGEPRELRDYFLNWLDFDLIVGSLTDSSAPIWVFYSGRRLGRKSERVEHDVLSKYIERINALPGVTAYDVEIPGEQREPITVTCDKCGNSTSVVWESEKGVDAALIVHLFDTIEAWDRALLLSGDADFTPAVRSLRRRGKRISGASFSASKSLIRELEEFTNLSDPVLRADFAAYKLFGERGVVEHWLTDPVEFEPQHEARFHVNTRVKWAVYGPRGEKRYSGGQPLLIEDSASVLFEDEGLFGLNARDKHLFEFATAFPEFKHGEKHFFIPLPGWESVKRRLPLLIKRFDGAMVGQFGELTVQFDKTPDGAAWQLSHPSSN